MKKIIFILLIFISVQTIAQSSNKTLPKIDSAQLAKDYAITDSLLLVAQQWVFQNTYQYAHTKFECMSVKDINTFLTELSKYFDEQRKYYHQILKRK